MTRARGEDLAQAFDRLALTNPEVPSDVLADKVGERFRVAAADVIAAVRADTAAIMARLRAERRG